MMAAAVFLWSCGGSGSSSNRSTSAEQDEPAALPAQSTPGWRETLAEGLKGMTGDIVANFSEGLALVRSTGKWGFIDKTGKEVISFVYDGAGNFSEGLAMVRSTGKWGFIDKTGKEVISFVYDGAGNFSEGLARVSSNGKWGFIDKTGKEVIPFIYDDAGNFSEGLASVRSNGKWGFIDKTGKEVIPCIYKYVYSFSEGLVRVSVENSVGIIDIEGNFIGEGVVKTPSEMLQLAHAEAAEAAEEKRQFDEEERQWRIAEEERKAEGAVKEQQERQQKEFERVVNKCLSIANGELSSYELENEVVHVDGEWYRYKARLKGVLLKGTGYPVPIQSSAAMYVQVFDELEQAQEYVRFAAGFFKGSRRWTRSDTRSDTFYYMANPARILEPRMNSEGDIVVGILFGTADFSVLF
jgi:hypothetical protein